MNKKKTSLIWTVFFLLFIYGNLAVYAETEEDTEANRILSSMTLEEKVAQMFIISPEALTGVDRVTAAGETTEQCLNKYPVGGLIYFSENIESKEQIEMLLSNTQRYSMERVQLPIFTCIDEEGGIVTRISGKGVIDVPEIDTMEKIGNAGEDAAYQAGKTIGKYLFELGFNVDFAPVADVATNPKNSVIGSRSFGKDAALDARMVSDFVKGMHEEHIFTTLKHFPGHGDTKEDSHTGAALSYKTLDELSACEFIPFQSGMKSGSDFIMIGHITLPNVMGELIPATMSYEIITEILRERLGFTGIVVTDAMNMAAVSDFYSSSEAAVKAVQAGADMILMPASFVSAYEGILNSVEKNEITEERINESVKRIISVKKKLMTGNAVSRIYPKGN